MKKMMKRPMKKAEGGNVKTTATKGKSAASPRPAAPVAGFPGRGAGLRTAMENANANARFNRPATGGPMAPSRPAMPAMPRAMPVPPMRRAKGGMAKGKK